MRYFPHLILPLISFLSWHTAIAFPTESECQTKYESANQAFTQGLKAFQEGHPKTVAGLPEQAQICTLYYLWQRAEKEEEEGGYYKAFPEKEGACWNVWGQWSPINKETYMKLCTGKMMY